MNTLRFTLRKEEILRGYQSFSEVLSKGKSLQQGSIRCFFLVNNDPQPSILVGFSVSRSVRKAAIRNRLKRLMREAYRKNKHLLLDASASNRRPLKVVFLCLNKAGVDPRKIRLMEIEQSIVALLTEIRSQM